MRVAPTEADIEASIQDARAKLDRFESAANARAALVRLRIASPFHPFLVLRALGMFAAVLMAVSALAALAAPLVSDDAAELVARLDAAAHVPLFLVLAVLVLCMFGVGVGAHYAALAMGRSAPLLPDEARLHQRLLADLQQLEAQKAVLERISPFGTQPRIVPPNRYE